MIRKDKINYHLDIAFSQIRKEAQMELLEELMDRCISISSEKEGNGLGIHRGHLKRKYVELRNREV